MTTLGLVPNPVTVDQLVDDSLLPLAPFRGRGPRRDVIVASGPVAQR